MGERRKPPKATPSADMTPDPFYASLQHMRLEVSSLRDTSKSTNSLHPQEDEGRGNRVIPSPRKAQDTRSGREGIWGRPPTPVTPIFPVTPFLCPTSSPTLLHSGTVRGELAGLYHTGPTPS